MPIIHDSITYQVSCAPLVPITDVSGPYYRLYAIIDLYTRLGRRSISENDTLDDLKTCGSRSTSPSAECSPLVPARNYDSVRCAIAYYAVWDLRERPKKIDEYFDLNIGDEDARTCSIKIQAKTRTRGCINNKYNNPACRLAKELGNNVATFTYAATPRNMVQRLGMSSLDHDILSTISRGDGKLAVQVMEMLRQRSQKLELAQGFPIIVGRGSNQPTSPGPESDARARFGWVIAPTVRGTINPSSATYLQTTQQYTLAAVVSVPSWWRRVRISYTTCWVDARSVRQTQWYDSSICPTFSTVAPTLIDLPGRTDEISQKLGLWVIKQPSLETDQKWDLKAGRKQAIVIQGTRLWRSTAVTLGSQKADKIEVLPNMGGIIATFDCLQDPDLYPKLQVWTSEGVTDSMYVKVSPAMDSFSCLPRTQAAAPSLTQAAAPSLDDGQQWTLTAGRRQTMVVRGKRLWDGTVVTLGSQKADAIELDLAPGLRTGR